MNEPKEVDVFRKYTRFTRLRLIIISSVIFLVLLVFFYLFAKTLFPYYITYQTDGGMEYDHELKPQEYSFRERTRAPEHVKKPGYYLVGWYTDKACTKEYKFGQKIWSSFTLYAKWAEGNAIILNFADGEENTDMSTYDLKLYYEWYVKPGSEYFLPHVFNNSENSNHKGEQLLFYENPECTGVPFADKTFVVNDDINIYGKWFDTDENKFKVDGSGELQEYLGHCNKIFIPISVTSIRDAVSGEGFNTGVYGMQINDKLDHFSVWYRVRRDLKEVYISANCTKIGNCAFRACENLNKIVFMGNSVSSIGVEAFRDCEKLSEITIPEGVTEVSQGCFRGMNSKPIGNNHIATITFLGEIESIGDEAFLNCWVGELSFGNLTFVGKFGFAGCVNLSKITFACDHVINTNVNTPVESSPGADDCDNLFYGADPTIQIFVPGALVDSYKTTAPWSTYADHITAITF